MYRKSITGFFFLFAFFVIAISGYQCATQVTQGPDEGFSINDQDRDRGVSGDNNRGDGYYYDDDYLSDRGGGDDSRLPPEPKDNCPRSTYRDFEKKYGEMAIFKIDSGSIEDYRLGASLNFGVNCARIFVNMNRASGSKVYKGKLVIAYDDGRRGSKRTFSSGFTTGENRYNRWTEGAWTSDSKGVVNKKFHAIYESQDAAIILKIDHVEERDIRDGTVDPYGYGEIYYKMFRYDKTAGRGDRCFQGGAYMRHFGGTPIRKNGRCWLLTTGPWSCRPHGVLEPRSKGRVPLFKDINITGSLPCYNRLGIFRNLHLKGAFNVKSITDI